MDSKINQKICVISFDHWNYDKHIVSALNEIGVESFHIKIGNFKYKNNWERINNSLSKIFLRKNPKIKKRQEYIIEMLEKHGKQNQILVINPELIDLEYHLLIKKYTEKYLAYLYDSVSRCSIEHLLNGIFDQIFSFDKEDVIKYKFNETTNYIYYQNKLHVEPKYDYIYVGSIDNRVKFLNEFGDKLKERKLKFKFYSIGKKAWIYKLKKTFGNYKNIEFSNKRFNQKETLELYKNSKCIVDVVRDNQSGLSFRFFEAMGLNKNVITNNLSVTKYDIYSSGKIKLFNDENYYLNKDDYPKEIIYKYSIQNWIINIFNLNN